MPPKELAVLCGISSDKVEKIAGWSRNNAGDGGEWLATIAARLKPDETLELKVSKLPEPINVTPAPESASELTVSRPGPISGTEIDKPDSWPRRGSSFSRTAYRAFLGG
jgi:hypothetical protein